METTMGVIMLAIGFCLRALFISILQSIAQREVDKIVKSL